MTLLDIDNSGLTPVGECTTKAALVALDYGGRSDSRDAMDAGNVFHAGLQKHFEGGSRDESFAAFDLEYFSLFPVEKPAQEDRLSLGNLQDIFGVYIDRHPLNIQPYEVLSAETIIGCPLDDVGEINIWAKRDLKIRDKATGFIMPLDHKTTGGVNHRWQSGWSLCSQLPGYCWITNKETGAYCPGAYVNAIEIRLLPSSSSRCAKHGMKYNECRLEHTLFKMLYYDYTRDVIDGWRATAIVLARRFLLIKKQYPTLEHIKYAPQEGLTNRSCAFCQFKKFCQAGRYPHTADIFLSYNHFAPWESEDAVWFDWRR